MRNTHPAYSRILSLALSFAIVFTGTPFQLFFQARAQSGSEPPKQQEVTEATDTKPVSTNGTNSITPVDSQNPEDVLPTDDQRTEEEKEFEERLEEIREKIIDPANGHSAGWDPFLLLDQFVVDERRLGINAEILKVRIEDYQDRLEFRRERIQEIEDFRSELQALSANLAETDTRRQAEVALAMQDLDSRQAMHEVELEDLKNYNPEKGGEVLDVEHFVDEEIPRRSYLGSKLQIQILNAAGETVSTIAQKDYTESLSPRFSAENPIANLPEAQGPYSFAIHHPKGERLHIFKTPIQSIGFFGHFLVFEDARKGTQEESSPLRMINLETFRFAVGNSALPVFTLPLRDADPTAPMRISEGRLHVGGQILQLGQIVVLSQIFQAIYNVNVALVDPATYKNAKLLVSELFNFLGTSVNAQGQRAQEQIKQLFEAEAAVAKATTILGDAKPPVTLPLNALKELVQTVQEKGELNPQEMAQLQSALHLRAGLQESNAALGESRRFFNRVKLFNRSLFFPRPEGAPKLSLRNALIALSSRSEKGQQMREGLARNPFNKYAKYGSAATGVVVAAHSLPKGYGLQLQQSVSFMSDVWAHFQGYLAHMDYGRAFGDLSKDAFFTSTSGITYVWSSYFSDGKWAQFAVGLATVLWIPLKIFLAAHLLVNSAKIFLDTKATGPELDGKKLGLLQRFVKSAANQYEGYWKRTEDAEKQESGSDVEALTERDVELLLEFNQRMANGEEGAKALAQKVKKLKKNRSFKRSLRASLNTIFSGKQVRDYGLDAGEEVKSFVKAKQLKAPETVLQALWTSFTSYYSLSATFKTTNSIWNWLFIGRLAAFSPTKWLMFLTYPNYFSVAVRSSQSPQHFPTRYNSGLDSWGSKLRKLFSRAANSARKAESPPRRFNPGNFFMSKEGLEALNAFETAVLPIEATAMSFAFRQAQLALIRKMDSPEDVLELFNSASSPTIKLPGQEVMQTTTGIKSLHDSKISKLSDENRIYFRAFYTRAFDQFMQDALYEVTTSKAAAADLNPEAFAKALVQEVAASEGKLSLNTEKAENAEFMEDLENRIEERMDFQQIHNFSEKMTAGWRNLGARTKNEFRHKLLQSVHPGNGSILRYLISKEKMDDQRAMDRAVRMEISNLMTTIPIGIGTTLVMFAGVQTGLLQPFDSTAMDSLTHTIYMSNYLFYNGFVPSLILGILANTWMKLQTDSRQADMGSFSKVPLQKDAEKTHTRFFVKNLVKNPTNKWRDNHLFHLKLITLNIPAALVTTIAFNWYGLGRFDVGSYIAGYMLIYATMFTGLDLKVDQAFELSSSWVRAQFPRKWRAHRDIQKKIFSKIQRKKNIFALWTNFYEIIVFDNLAGTMVTMKDSAIHGTRGFLQLLFGGTLPTILVDKFFAAVQTLPGLGGLGGALRHAFTNNFEAFERFPERLVDTTEAADRVARLNEALPKAPVAEALGKTLGLFSVVGGVAAAPYAVDGVLRGRRSRKQKKENDQLLGQETEVAQTIRKMLEAKQPVEPAPGLRLEDVPPVDTKPEPPSPSGRSCRAAAE